MLSWYPVKRSFEIRKNKLVLPNSFLSTHAFSTTHTFFINQVEGIHCFWRAKWIALKRIWRKQPGWMLFSSAGAVSLALATKEKWSTLEKSLDLELYFKDYHGQKWPLLTPMFCTSLIWSQVPSWWYSVEPWDRYIWGGINSCEPFIFPSAFILLQGIAFRPF